MDDQKLRKFREQLSDDYQGALCRVATLRSAGRQYLLFGWVELFPHDMVLPKGWNSGRPWTVPGVANCTCSFSAARMSVEDALDWYERAGRSSITFPRVMGGKVEVRVVDLGPEPNYGQFCTTVDAPFCLDWHLTPRIHRHVPLTEHPLPVRQLGASVAAREWLKRHLGFDPFQFNEWLGGLALIAPDPICLAISAFPISRSPGGPETLCVHAIPRKSRSKGVADLSSLSIQLAERRVDGRKTFQTIQLDRAGYATVISPHPYNRVAYAIVCAKRGLIGLTEPTSWMSQVNIGVSVVNSILNVAVPPGGRRKPTTSVSVNRLVETSNVTIGKPLSDVTTRRLAHLRERRKARDLRAAAPQRLFGVVDRSDSQQIVRKRKEAEDFIGALISQAKHRVFFVDPFFGQREMRLFAMRVSPASVVPRILTGKPALEADGGGAGDLFAADLEAIRQRHPEAAVPTVRVMPGGDRSLIHDRYLVVDREVWHCGPSFNELGERLGVMVRLPNPISIRSMINKVWSRSIPLSTTWRTNQKLAGDDA